MLVQWKRQTIFILKIEKSLMPPYFKTDKSFRSLHKYNTINAQNFILENKKYTYN